MPRTDYRTCHVDDDAVSGYQRTYASGYYAAQWRQLEMPLLSRLFAELRDRGCRRMLDIACGQGRITLLAARLFDDVLGVDYSPEMLAIAKQRLAEDAGLDGANVRFDVGDVHDFVAGEPFDVITAFRFFLNAEDGLRGDGLRCVRRNLAPGGTFVTNVHVAGGSPLAMFYQLSNSARRLRGKAPNLVRNSISLRAFRRLLASEGFEIKQVHRYSLLPRLGSLTDAIAERHMAKVDRVGNAIPGAALLCQSFLVCAQLTSANS